mmetsp:Transcript_28335/g.70813  ORF Transcript_28335/g.70813 Transcript_28335/m.70813 type:complete len:80 (+) Transcript_28335:445-684(+)
MSTSVSGMRMEMEDPHTSEMEDPHTSVPVLVVDGPGSRRVGLVAAKTMPCSPPWTFAQMIRGKPVPRCYVHKGQDDPVG